MLEVILGKVGQVGRGVSWWPGILSRNGLTGCGTERDICGAGLLTTGSAGKSGINGVTPTPRLRGNGRDGRSAFLFRDRPKLQGEEDGEFILQIESFRPNLKAAQCLNMLGCRCLEATLL